METKYCYHILKLTSQKGKYHASMSLKAANDLVRKGKATLVGKTFEYSRRGAIEKVLNSNEFELVSLREVEELLRQ